MSSESDYEAQEHSEAVKRKRKSAKSRLHHKELNERSKHKFQVDDDSEIRKEDNDLVVEYQAKEDGTESSNSESNLIEWKRMHVGKRKKRKDPDLKHALKVETKLNFTQICRLCMNRINDYDSALISKRHCNYAQKISVCCGITADLINLPQHICNTCIDSLEQAYTFRQKCFKVNKKLLKACNRSRKKNRPRAAKVKCQRNYSDNVLDAVKTEIVDVLDVEYLAQDDKTSLRKLTKSLSEKKYPARDLAANIDVQKKNNNNINTCNVDFIKKEELFLENDAYYDDNFQDGESTHDDDVIVEKKRIKIYSIRGDGDSSEEAEFCCDICPYVSVSITDYELHLESHCSGRIKKDFNGTSVFCQAQDCEWEFTKFLDRRAHVLECHKDESFNGYLDICPFCAKALPLSHTKTRVHSKLDYHIRSIHRRVEEPQVCDMCDYQSKSRAQMRVHKHVKHSRVTEVQCPECGKSMSLYKLKRHLGAVHKKKQNLPACTYCDKRFFDNYNLKSHMRTHTGELPFKCPDCEQAFSHNVSMKTHRLKVHHIDMFKKKLN